KAIPPLEPASGAVVESAPVLRWQPLAGALVYRVMVIDAGTTELLVDEQIDGTVFTVTAALTPGHTYQWLAQGLGEAGVLLGEGESTFTVGPIGETATTGSPQISLNTGSMASGFETETIAAVPAGENVPPWEVL